MQLNVLRFHFTLRISLVVHNASHSSKEKKLKLTIKKVKTVYTIYIMARAVS